MLMDTPDEVYTWLIPGREWGEKATIPRNAPESVKEFAKKANEVSMKYTGEPRFNIETDKNVPKPA